MDDLPVFPEQLTTCQPVLRFYLLGPPTVTWNGTNLVISRRSVRALLYRLACDSGPVTRGHLHLLFWPDVPESVARRNLSHHLTHLRRALPSPQLLVATNEQVWLEPGKFWCDAIILKNFSFDCPPDISYLRNLAGLYRASFMEEFDMPGCPEFEHWWIVERSFLERQYLKVLECLVEYCTKHGETGQAIKYAQRYLETDPLSEAMHRRLIQLYAASGDRHLALQQFERCSSILESELGVSPLPETRVIYQAVLYGQLRFPEPSLPLRPPQLPDPEVPIIGREDELSKIEEAFLKLPGGQGHVVLISGEAGIGKSALMQAFAKRHQEEAVVLYGTSRACEQVIPYQSIIQPLRTMLGFGDKRSEPYHGVGSPNPPIFDLIDPVWLTEISRLLPELQSIYPGLGSPLPLEPESARTRLFDAFCHLILVYTKTQGPVLLCLDDLQWVDTPTKAWLVYIGRFLESSGYPILILGTYRSEEAKEVLDLRHALARAGVLTELKLTGLKETAVLELVRHLVGQRSCDERIANQLYLATGGNPFYLIEIVRKLIEEGQLEGHVQESIRFTLPESIREAIHVRVQRLSPIACQLLEAGAILGQSFDIELLRLTAGRSHNEFSAAVEELVARILLVETGCNAKGESVRGYRFIHEITRQYVEESLGEVRRQLLHRRAGRAYRRLIPDAFPALAYHSELGGDQQKALHYHELAAQQANTLFAWQAVEYHQGRMLELLERVDPGFNQMEYVYKRGGVFAGRARIHYLLDRLPERDADLEALSDLGEASNNDQIRLQALINRLRYLNLDGEYIQAIAIAEKGLDLLNSSHTLYGDMDKVSAARSRLLTQVGFAYYFLGIPAEALTVLEEALNLCGEKTIPEAYGRILHILGYVHSHLGDYPRSLEYQQQAYAYHQEIEDYQQMAWDLIDIGALHKSLGSIDNAQSFLDEGLELSCRMGSQQAKAYGLTHYGSLDLYRGNYTAAAAHYQRALEIQQGTRSEHIIASAEAGLGFTLYHLGETAQSRHWLERALGRTWAIGYRRCTAEILIQLGLLDIEEKRLSLARQHLEEALAIAQDCQAGKCLALGWAVMARLEMLTCNTNCALEMATEAVIAARRINLTCCEMWGEIETGLAYHAIGDLPSALVHTQRGVSLAPFAGQDWIGREEAYSAHAKILRANKDDEAANHYEQCAKNTLRAKAYLISDSIQPQSLRYKSRQLE